MKYCPRCGMIYSDQSDSYERENCLSCAYKDLEEDDMTSEKYDLLTEEQKDEYEIQLIEKIKSSPVFDEQLYRTYNERGTSNFYYCFRFDKYEDMTGERADWKRTPEEIEASERQLRVELKEYMEKYGPGTAYYEQEKRREAAERARESRLKNANIPRCPICQSTNLKKLGKFSFMNSFGVNMNDGGIPSVFPVFGMKQNDKTWKCNNCGSKF